MNRRRRRDGLELWANCHWPIGWCGAEEGQGEGGEASGLSRKIIGCLNGASEKETSWSLSISWRLFMSKGERACGEI